MHHFLLSCADTLSLRRLIGQQVKGKLEEYLAQIKGYLYDSLNRFG